MEENHESPPQSRPTSPIPVRNIFLNPNKSPKNSSIPSPHRRNNGNGNFSTQRRKSPLKNPTSIDEINAFFKNMKSSIAEPQELKRLDSDSVKLFLKESKKYFSNGGEKSLEEFIDKSLLATIRFMELGDPNASSTAVLEYLSKCVKHGRRVVKSVLSFDGGDIFYFVI